MLLLLFTWITQIELHNETYKSMMIIMQENLKSDMLYLRTNSYVEVKLCSFVHFKHVIHTLFNIIYYTCLCSPASVYCVLLCII